MKWYLKVLKQFLDFNGRSRRKEFWMFFLFFNIFFLISCIPKFTLDFYQGLMYGMKGEFPTDNHTLVSIQYVFQTLYLFVLFVPSIAVSVRRLHDIGKSGWLLLISLFPILGSIFLLVLFCLNGNIGQNKYGSDPKEMGAS